MTPKFKTHDLLGRAYIRLEDIRPGTKLQFDDGFDGLKSGKTYTARVGDGDSSPFVLGDLGRHYLDVQADCNDGYCIGVYAAPEA